MNVYKYLAAVHSPDGPEDHRVRTVLMVLAKHWNLDTGQCNPGTRRIAEHARMARNTIRIKLDDAEAAGWIRRRVKKRGGQSGSYTEYELVIPAYANSDLDEMRVTSEVTRSPENAGQHGVTRSPDVGGSDSDRMRVNSEPERVSFDEMRVNSEVDAGHPRGGPEQQNNSLNNSLEQQEQRKVEKSTGKRHGMNGDGAGNIRSKIVRSVALPNGDSQQLWTDYLIAHPEALDKVKRFRVAVDTGNTEWERGECFASPDVLEEWKPTKRAPHGWNQEEYDALAH